MHLKAVSPLPHIHLVNILFACTPTPLDGPFGPEENWWVGRISLSVEYSVLPGLVPLDQRKIGEEEEFHSWLSIVYFGAWFLERWLSLTQD